MDRPVKIVMLGAGGTGGYVAPYLFRLLHMLDRPARFVICDGDIVELKNLDRQNFVPADLGENKARILAERYSTVLGMETEYVPNFIETLPELMALIAPNLWETGGFLNRYAAEMVILLGCVDNNRTRQLCHEAFRQSEDLVYIDSGNGSYTGQVVCGVRRNGHTMRKPIGSVHPEMLRITDKFPSELSCAEAAQADPQSIVANVTAATAVLTMVIQHPDARREYRASDGLFDKDDPDADGARKAAKEEGGMKKITVDAKAFAEAMNKVSRVLKKSALPILEEIAVSVKDGRCTLAATDMDTWLAAELPVCGDDLSFVFQRTKDVMKACAHFEGKLALTLDTEGKKNWKLELHCGQRAATFTAASYEDYPECRTVENDASLRVNAAELFRSVERVRYAVQRADPSTNPKAACIQFRGNRIFSLDGRRMACDTQPDTVFPLPCLLSGDALVHLKAFGDCEVTMQVDERAVCFSSGTLKLYARRYGADTYDPDTAIPQSLSGSDHGANG